MLSQTAMTPQNDRLRRVRHGSALRRAGHGRGHDPNDERFRTVSGRVILVIAAVCVARGAYELVAA